MSAPPRPAPAHPLAPLRDLTRRIRHRLPLRRLLIGAALVGIVVIGLRREQNEIRDARAAWDAVEVVHVMTRDVGVGEVITGADVEVRTVPAVVAPTDALDARPVGARVRTALAEGEVVREGRLAPASLSPIAARLPPRWEAITVTGIDTPVAVDDEVTVYELLTGDVAATRALVIAIDDRVATIAVSTADTPAIVRSISTGGVVVAISGPEATPGS